MPTKLTAKRAPKSPPPARESAPNPSVIANSIHSVRRRRGLTLAQMAEATDLDKGYLSRVERGQKSPSIGTLLRIAEALGVQVGHLFGETTIEDAITVVRNDQHIDIAGGDGNVSVFEAILPASNQRRLSAYIVEPGIEPDNRGADHPGDELLYVLSGAMAIDFLDRSIELGTGDCVHFDGHLRHQIRQIGMSRARALVIVAQDVSARRD